MTISVTTQQALDIWRGALVDGVRGDKPDLSARQLALMLTVYLTDPPHTVRGLSKELGIAKPAVTRALDALERQDFVRRGPDPDDKRSIRINRTVKGSVHLTEFADFVSNSIARVNAQ